MRERAFALALAALALLAGPDRAAAAVCTLQKIADLPVTMSGRNATIPAQINGQEARFFIDTGSFFSAMNPASAAKFGLRLGPLDPHIHIMGVTGEVDAHVTTAKTLTFAGIPFSDVEFLVGEHGLGSADGLIGQNVLGGPDVEYDFANGVMRLFRPKDCGSASLAYWSPDGAGVAELSILPMDAQGRRILGSATLNGVKIRVVFDSGASRSVLTVGGARRAGVRTDGPDVVQVGGSSGVGARVVRSWIAPFQSFEIGGEQVKATRIGISDLDMHDADMLLGADFFLSHRIYISRTQGRVYFTYNGGPVFTLEQGAPPPKPVPAPPNQPSSQVASALGAAPASAEGESGEAPKDAGGFARRAAAEMSRHAYDAAIADDSQAIALEPTEATHYFDRGMARLLDRQPVVALSDLDQAVKLKPDYAAALVVRGQLKLARKDAAGASADFDAALRADPNAGAGIAQSYLVAGKFADAERVVSAYIAAHPRNEDLALALDLRCRVRAYTGEGLEQALKDCNDAIRFRPGVGEALASRGLVELRLGKNDAAMSDFNEAIRQQPRAPWALYGRGVIEARKGQKAQSDADLAAAAAISPHIPDEAKAVGLAP